MPVPKNKPTTRVSEVSTPETSSPVLPEQEEFRQYLRRLAVSAVQVLIEHVMREELDSRFPETVRASFIARCSSATTVTNRRWPRP